MVILCFFVAIDNFGLPDSVITIRGIGTNGCMMIDCRLLVVS